MQTGQIGIEIAGMAQVLEPQGRGQQLVGGVADDLAEAGVDPDQFIAECQLVDADRGIVEQDAEPLFGLA